MRALIAILTALMLFATTPVAAGEYRSAFAAFQAGDYQKAFRLYKRGAEQGDGGYQGSLGMMYALGQGISADYGHG